MRVLLAFFSIGGSTGHPDQVPASSDLTCALLMDTPGTGGSTRVTFSFRPACWIAESRPRSAAVPWDIVTASAPLALMAWTTESKPAVWLSGIVVLRYGALSPAALADATMFLAMTCADGAAAPTAATLVAPWLFRKEPQATGAGWLRLGLPRTATV